MAAALTENDYLSRKLDYRCKYCQMVIKGSVLELLNHVETTHIGESYHVEDLSTRYQSQSEIINQGDALVLQFQKKVKFVKF